MCTLLVWDWLCLLPTEVRTIWKGPFNLNKVNTRAIRPGLTSIRLLHRLLMPTHFLFFFFNTAAVSDFQVDTRDSRPTPYCSIPNPGSDILACVHLIQSNPLCRQILGNGECEIARMWTTRTCARVSDVWTNTAHVVCPSFQPSSGQPLFLTSELFSQDIVRYV